MRYLQSCSLKIVCEIPRDSKV